MGHIAMETESLERGNDNMETSSLKLGRQRNDESVRMRVKDKAIYPLVRGGKSEGYGLMKV